MRNKSLLAEGKLQGEYVPSAPSLLLALWYSSNYLDDTELSPFVVQALACAFSRYDPMEIRRKPVLQTARHRVKSSSQVPSANRAYVWFLGTQAVQVTLDFSCPGR